jgi:hypothetical protein
VTDASTMKTCADYGARVGEKHEDGCDVERCPHCGGQALGCIGFDPNDPRRQPWDGKWPGEADCERLDALSSSWLGGYTGGPSHVGAAMFHRPLSQTGTLSWPLRSLECPGEVSRLISGPQKPGK